MIPEIGHFALILALGLALLAAIDAIIGRETKIHQKITFEPSWGKIDTPHAGANAMPNAIAANCGAFM